MKDAIAEIGIDDMGRLFVRPAQQTFPHIYRTASEVHWDVARGYLYAPAALKGWTRQQWYRHIIDVVRLEAYCVLEVTAATRFINLEEGFGS
ncbi:hypothetical protein [Flavobacterium sp.]|uniref:hypothetical protein n=1 Tax=Flavobacterium sp. TaxID=239 RepID=UPI0026136AF2|nr:hypothetical protein [Flavobacterium sp.]